MKRKLLHLLMLLCISVQVFAQTIVSTSVQKRNVVFEDYCGTNDGYSPNAHAHLNSYAQQNPGTVVINIHQGNYAAAYTTQWGNALANQTNLGGYPAFTISRQLSGCSVNNYYGANNYTTVANNIKNANSPVNLAATAEIDAITRTMTVHVEAYYTANVAQNFNMLQVVLLQDNIIGTQANYGTYNPAQILPDGSYRHMHMLRDMVTGKQWGDTIALNTTGTITAGTYVEKDYTYQIPATISNKVVELGDINLAVFVTDGVSGYCSTHAPNIWTGVKVEPTYTNISENNAEICSTTLTDQYGCSENVSAKMVVRNLASEINSMTVTYRNTTTEQTSHIFNYTGNLSTFQLLEIELDDLPIELDVENQVICTITSINGEQKNITSSATIMKPTPPIAETLMIKTDQYGSEFTWKIVDQDDDVIEQGGPYTDGSSQTYTINLTNLFTNGCCTFIAMDSYGDGLGSTGYIRLLDASGNILVNKTGSYSVAKIDFKTQCLVGDVIDNVKYKQGTDSTVIVIHANYFGNVVIPETIETECGTFQVTSIGDSAFFGCTGLTSVTIPNSVTSIGNSAFSGCNDLTSITIPNSITSIDNSVFSGCSGLTSITIPNSVTSIGSSAFEGCSGLTSITIPNSVTSIGSSAFGACSGLTSIIIPNSVTSIGDETFLACTGLTSLTIPNSVISIGYYAFAGCSGLTNITIPNSVTSIGREAFYLCSDLTSLVVPNSVTYIGDGAFAACISLTNVLYNAANCTTMGSFEYPVFLDCISLSSLTIGDSVNVIPSYAFRDCESLTNIIIPDNVISIGASAFDNCSGLTDLTIGKEIESIGAFAFEGCNNIQTLNWNSMNCRIYNNVFINKPSIINLNIGNNVQVLPDNFMYGCSSLEWIDLPNSITSIGKSAFENCGGITHAFISENVFEIEERTFANCSSLTNIKIPNNVRLIGTNSFSDCKNLHKLYIGESVETIENNAFSNCNRLDTIRVKAHYPPTIQANTFSGVNVATPLVVPCGRLSYYQNAEHWSNFIDMIEDCNMSDGDVSIEEVAEESMLRIYPNPVMDNAVLSIDNLKEDVKVILTDEQGREISLSTMKAGEREINLNTNSLPKGIYFLRIVGETIQRTEKIIKK